nr:MAG: hypothetical protein [Microvirus sp.]QJB20571.1 MAG: hypothetical protein [Microvirus sp.]
MRKRHKLKSKHSKKLFTRTAKKVHAKNGGATIMRGGIRL